MPQALTLHLGSGPAAFFVFLSKMVVNSDKPDIHKITQNEYFDFWGTKTASKSPYSERQFLF
jgi:hypothetical protein